MADEHAVVWREGTGDDELFCGGLTVGESGGLFLRGSNGSRKVHCRIDRGEVASVSRARLNERIAGLRSLRFELTSGRVLVVASIFGIGVLRELQDLFDVIP